MRTTDNFDHDPPRKAASDSRASSTARNQAPRQPVRRPPVQMDNDSYDDDIRYDDELDEQQDQYDPEYDEYDDYDEPAPWYDSFWFICVCLVICPPYALYRIWKDERFTLTNRWLISAIDVCWMLIILILLFSSLFARDNSSSDVNGVNSVPTSGIDISMPSVDPNASASTSPSGSAGPQVTPDPNASPSASSTALAGNTVAQPGQSAAPGTTLRPSATSTASATTRPTSTTNSSQKVWYTSRGTYYHSTSTCGGTMSGASQHTLAEAEAANKKRCPYCYDGVPRGDSSSGSSSGSSTTHTTVTRTARPTTRPTARVTQRPTANATTVVVTPTPQPTPASTSPYAVMVYFNVNGEYYHSISNCQGMKNAGYYTIGQAIDAGKKRCPVCNAPEPGSTVTPSPSPVPTPTPVPTPIIHIVWYRPDSQWYHAVSNCQGMVGATRHTLGEAIDDNKPPCPYCHPPTADSIYATATPMPTGN